LLISKDLLQLDGRGILKKYNESPHLLISSIFSDYEWLPWKFQQVPHAFWEDVNNQRKFVNWVSKELEIKNFDVWYKVSQKVVYGNG
jgi:hypothetical protein